MRDYDSLARRLHLWGWYLPLTSDHFTEEVMPVSRHWDPPKFAFPKPRKWRNNGKRTGKMVGIISILNSKCCSSIDLWPNSQEGSWKCSSSCKWIYFKKITISFGGPHIPSRLWNSWRSGKRGGDFPKGGPSPINISSSI